MNGLLFANAAVKTMESKLFGAEKLGRLSECDNLSDAVRILREGGFGAQSDSDDYESMLANEEQTLETFVRKNAPKGAGFECIWLKTDYHNLKTALKAKYFDMDDEDLYLSGGNRPAEEIKDAVVQEGKSLGEYMDKVTVKVAALRSENALTPKAVDETADRAMYDEIAALVSARGVARVVKDYFRAEADLTNVLSYRRVIEAGMDYKAFANCCRRGYSVGQVFPSVQGRADRIRIIGTDGIKVGRYRFYPGDGKGKGRIFAQADDGYGERYVHRSTDHGLLPY